MTDTADNLVPQSLPATVAEMLELEQVERDVYRVGAASGTDPRGLYGGRVAAQALRAAVFTIPDNRIVHSLHGYFLRPGDATDGLTLSVERDRDGGRYSTRRVTVTQKGKTIFNLSASFQSPQSGPDYQTATMPLADDPETLEDFPLDRRMLDLDARIPTDDREGWHRWPTRLWMRIREPLGDDPNVHACAVTFLSDMCTGLSKAPRVEHVGILPSLDHAVWLHRPVRADEWVLMDLTPETTFGGRGMYTGRIYGRDGTLVASLAQESLFNIRPASEHLPSS